MKKKKGHDAQTKTSELVHSSEDEINPIVQGDIFSFCFGFFVRFEQFLIFLHTVRVV